MEGKLRAAIKAGMIEKNKDGSLKNVLILKTRKNILETAQKIAKEKLIDVSDSVIYDAAKKEVKQLEDLLTFCDKNEEKRKETEICLAEATNWLPKMISKDEIRNFIETHKSDASNIGAMMKLLKESFGDSLDGKVASKLAKEIL